MLVQLEHLRTPPAVASRLKRGDLHLHGGVYKIETGQVFAYDAPAGQFAPVADYGAQADGAAAAAAQPAAAI